MAHNHIHRDADLELGELDRVPNDAAGRIRLSGDEEALLRNLLRIRQLGEERLLQLAEEWGKKAKLFGERVAGLQKQVLNVLNEIYQLVGFFSAFQGLLLMATAQSNMLRCNNQWGIFEGSKCFKKLYLCTKSDAIKASAAIPTKPRLEDDCNLMIATSDKQGPMDIVSRKILFEVLVGMANLSAYGNYRRHRERVHIKPLYPRPLMLAVHQYTVAMASPPFYMEPVMHQSNGREAILRNIAQLWSHLPWPGIKLLWFEKEDGFSLRGEPGRHAQLEGRRGVQHPSI